MKFIISLAAYFILVPLAQNVLLAQPDSTIQSVRMQFAVPDAPAFKILGTQADNILRPSTTQELAVALSDPLINSSLPSALALEFSPYLVIGGSSLTLRSYQESALQRILYHTRLSIASQRGKTTGDTTLLALGLRFTLLDESDLRLDESYIAKIFSFNDSVLALQTRIKDHFRGPAPSFIVKSKAERDSIDAKAKDSTDIATRALDSSITLEREVAKKRNWNKPIIEFGIALAGASAESTGTQGIIGTRAAMWLVGAANLGSWGQLVLGLNSRLRRSSSGSFSTIDGALSSRLYVGENAYKGFVQVESQIQDGTLRDLFQLGGEIRLYGVVWLDYSAGTQKVGSDPLKFTSSFNIRMGTP